MLAHDLPSLYPMLCLNTANPAGPSLQAALWPSPQVPVLVYKPQPNLPRQTPSAQLIPAIGQLCQQANLSPSQLKTVAIISGPGSFTGLRAGVATVRALAQAAQLNQTPLTVAEVNLFEAVLAALVLNQQAEAQAPVWLTLDARRGLAFSTGLSWNETSGVETHLLPALREASFQPEGPTWQTIDLTPALLETLNLPQAMAFLLNQQPQAYLKPWAKLAPLYLQAPNITLRQPQAGTFK